MEIKTIELVMLIIYNAALVWIGYYYRKKSENQGQFWVAERSIGAIVNGTGIFSAVASAASYMGFIALGYVYGMPVSLIIIAAASAGYAFAMFGFAAPLQRMGRFSLADVFGVRYGPVARLITAVLTITFFFLYLIPQLKGGALILEMVLGIPYTFGVVFIGTVFILYVAIGGMYAVTWTEFIQGIVKAFCMGGLAFIILATMGGPGNLFKEAVDAAPNFATISQKMPVISSIGLFLSIFLFMGASPHVVQRQLTARTPHIGRLSFVVAIALYAIFVFFGYMTIIPAGKIFFPALKDPDNLILYMIERYFNPAVAGIMLAGIMAAVQATVATMLLVIGANVANDLYKNFIKKDASEKETVYVGKLACVILGGLAILIALNPPGLIGVLVGLLTGVVGSTFFFPLWLGLWWERATAAGGIAGMLGGFILYVVLHLGKLMPLFAATIPAALFSLALTVAVSLITAPPPKEIAQLVAEIRDNVAV
ncbi:Na+/solute symporter [Desulfofundulus kuznetsovii DSM 6115]|uniref:Na+/solute symporter n=1 Tax=Desulfofundulus kuznetsovii (strain DSM 6115 / VKM B-1805 / 17) TaxID=760568 RepID=A0AAU8PEE0_DESK7|nr:Na+/solute symporter [Desulfofundulus kuznetsovii DSM 6115]